MVSGNRSRRKTPAMMSAPAAATAEAMTMTAMRSM
jgi:hypothetical protein